MRRKSSLKSNRIPSSTGRGQQLFTGGSTNAPNTLSYDKQKNLERPNDVRTLFQRLRIMEDESTFLSSYIPLKMSFYNDGFALTTGELASGNAAKQLADWLAQDYTTKAVFVDPMTNEELEIEYHMTNGDAVNRFVRDVWHEFLLLDTVVGMWLDNGGAPIILDPYRCRYQDKLGIPVVYYSHGIQGRDLDLLPPDQQERFKQRGEIMLNPKFGEHVKVLTRGLVGSGFVKPRLFSLLRTLGEVESKEIGFHGQAHNMRSATRHIKVGHSIDGGVHAGKGTWFINKKRADAVLKEFNNRQGPHDLVTNFDHTIEFPWPDIEKFDTVAWKGTDKRICNWGGVLAQMLIAEKVIEGGLGYERTRCGLDRQMIREFIKPIIIAAFKAPENVDLQITWSDLCFIDPARAAELLKFAVQQGISSVTTAQQIIGLNPDREAGLKVKEASDPDAEKKFRPMWDTSHALAPAQGQTAADLKTATTKSGADATTQNGHPAGTPNS